MSTNKTPLGLNQWELDEKLKMTDFNDDNEIIDQTLRELRSDLDDAQAELGRVGAAVEEGIIYPATATYTAGTFTLLDLPAELPAVYTVRFIAPEDYTYGDRIQVGGQMMNVVTVDGGAPQTGAFKAGVVVSMDVHKAGGRAFFKQGGGSGSGYGILPSQTQINVTTGDQMAQVSLSNPGGDAYAGTRLVCKQGSTMPQTQTDGQVFDAGQNQSFAITGLTNDMVHTVRAFAYNHDGEVQTDVNGAVKTVTPVAYSAPGNVSGFTAMAGAGTATLKWTDPVDAALAVWAGTKLVRKQGGYPADETDGTLVVDNKTRNQFASSGFADTGLDMGATYSYQAFPYSNMGMVNRNAANRVSVTTLSGIPLSELPVGALVRVPVNAEHQSRFGQYINWKIADQNHTGYPANSTTLITDKIIQIICVDGLERANTDVNRRNYGNNRFIHSNALQWLNSEGQGEAWYSPMHNYDTPPNAANVNEGNNYDLWPGFISIFAESFIKTILITELVVARSTVDNAGHDAFKTNLFLASATEVGLDNENMINEGYRLSIFTDNQSRLAYPQESCVRNSGGFTNVSFSIEKSWHWWLRTPYAQSSNYVRNVSTDGSSNYGHAYNGYFGLRPLCNLPNTMVVSRNQNADGSYNLVL